MTDAEKRLWSHLRGRQLGPKFRNQVWLGGYIVDFVSLEVRLVIEADGGQHDARRAYDARRTAQLEQLGYRVLRFWNDNILTNTDGVLQVIADAIPHPPTASRRVPPSPRTGEGLRRDHNPLPLGEREGPAQRS